MLVTAAAITLSLTANASAGCRRACRIMQPIKQTWICPISPSGVIVVGRDVCFIKGWPE